MLAINKILKFFFSILLINLFFISNALAYIDPGTGSIILQAIIGAVAAAGTAISIYWSKLKTFFSKKKNEKKDLPN